MPYKKYRKRRPGRKIVKKRGGGYLSTAAKALALALMLKRMINVEKKFIESATSSAQSTSATVALLTGIAQGDTQNDRNGNSIKAQSVSTKYNVEMNSSATATQVRIMLVIDKNSNGAAPVLSDILDNGVASNAVAHYNSDTAGSRFLILHDKSYSLSINGSRTISGSCYSKLNHHVKFTSSTGAQASCASGHLYLILWSDESTNTPIITQSSVFRYTDN